MRTEFHFLHEKIMTDQLASQGAWAAIAPLATGLALALSLVATFAAWTVAAATTLKPSAKWSAWGKHIMVSEPFKGVA